jgi:hypothetical protein
VASTVAFAIIVYRWVSNARVKVFAVGIAD